MAYLTYTEYNSIYGGIEIVDADRFQQLERRAALLLDALTRDFYRLNVLKEDFEFRRTKFKQAMALQIEFMFRLGIMNNDQFDSATEDSNNLLRNIAAEVPILLRGTGLLSSAVGVR